MQLAGRSDKQVTNLDFLLNVYVSPILEKDDPKWRKHKVFDALLKKYYYIRPEIN